MEQSTKTEEQFISDIKKSIQDTTLSISSKVIKSAFSYLSKNGCINPAKEQEANSFFVGKIPGVLSGELTKELNSVLGLNLELDK